MFFDINLYLIASFAIAVFAILNPFSTIPYYMLLHPNASRKDVKMDTKIIALASFAILLFSMLV
jgi:small neutral amino acid transporter SnatA (MarC family)